MIITKFRGIMQRADTEIPDNYASDCLNVRLNSELESVASRSGYTKLNSSEISASDPILGILQYKSGSTKRLLAACDQTLAYWNTNTFTNISTGLTAGGDYHSDNLNSLMIIVNGVQVPQTYNGSTLSALGGSPLQAKFVVVYKNYVLLLNVYDSAWYGSRMRISALANSASWPADSDSTLDFNPDDGEEITGAVKFSPGGVTHVRVFKESSVYVLLGDNPSTFAVYPYTVDEGAVSQRSIVVDENSLYWVGRKGIYKDTGEGAIRISDDIKDTIAAFNQTYVSKICGVKWEDTIRWAVPTGASTVPDKILIYYPRLNTWTIDDNWPIQRMAVIDTGSGPVLYGGGNALGYVHTLETGTADDGGNFTSYWTSKDFSEGALYLDKYWRRIRLTCKVSSSDYNLNFQYGIDGRTLCTADTKSLYNASTAYVTPEWWFPLAGDTAGGTGKTLRFKVGMTVKDQPWTMYAAALFAEVMKL